MKDDCNNCKYMKKCFDGIHGETWWCEELNKVMSASVLHKMDEPIKFFIKNYGFKCSLWEIKGKNNEYD